MCYQEAKRSQLSTSKVRTFHMCIVPATKLHIPVGQDSLLRRKINVKGRPEHWNQSINTKTSRKQKCSGETVPQRIRGSLWKMPSGEEDLPWPQLLCANGKRVDPERWVKRSNKITFNRDRSPLLHLPENWAMVSQGPGQSQSSSLPSGRLDSQGSAVISALATFQPHPLTYQPIRHMRYAPKTQMLEGVSLKSPLS